MRTIILIVLSSAVYAQTGQSSAGADTPKRTVFESKGQSSAKPASPEAEVKPQGAAGVPENGRGASFRALDTLSSSTENLNLIRDNNVRRLTKDGCAPEVSARIGDLRSKLQAAGVVLPPLERSARTGREESGPDNSTLALASNWFKAPTDGKASGAKDKSIDLLDSVLPAAGKGARMHEDVAGLDVPSLKAELEHLYAACPAAKR
jgi:hypothetical protein